jgi:hypothetical protein
MDEALRRICSSLGGNEDILSGFTLGRQSFKPDQLTATTYSDLAS